MQLPKAVQQQLEDADRMVAQINGQAPDEGEPPETTEPVSEPVEPSREEAAPEPVVTPTAEETWEQRYRTLQGMFDAEVPRLHAQTRELTTQVQVLANELEATRAEKIEQREKASITDEDREAFGPDLINLIERATEVKVETLRQRESQLVNEISELKSRLGTVAERQGVTDKGVFLNELSKKAPNWQSLNTDQGFLSWLSMVDPVYGIPRQIALNTAYEALDSVRVAAIFNAYSAVLTQTQKPKANSELLRQVAPTRSRSTSVPTDTQNTRIYSEHEIAEFYADWRRGSLSDDDAARIEADIHAAAAEGRIR